MLGEKYTLRCIVNGTNFTTYQWRKDGSVISGESGPTLSFSPLLLSDAGGYKCGHGTLFSDNFNVTIQSKCTKYPTTCNLLYACPCAPRYS